MTNRRRNFVLMLPVVGVVGAYFLPPMDEYAALDRIGERVKLSEVDGAVFWSSLTLLDAVPQAIGITVGPPSSGSASPYMRSGLAAGERRYWKLTLDKPQAKVFHDRFLSKRRSWSSTSIGFGTFLDVKGQRVNYSYEPFSNSMTGDQLEWAEQKYGTGTAKRSEFYVVVGRSPTSFGSKLLRWLTLSVSG